MTFKKLLIVTFLLITCTPLNVFAQDAHPWVVELHNLRTQLEKYHQLRTAIAKRMTENKTPEAKARLKDFDRLIVERIQELETKKSALVDLIYENQHLILAYQSRARSSSRAQRDANRIHQETWRRRLEDANRVQQEVWNQRIESMAPKF